MYGLYLFSLSWNVHSCRKESHRIAIICFTSHVGMLHLLGAREQASSSFVFKNTYRQFGCLFAEIGL